uniref:Ig-like domain-containing protein n=1 Tax=Denticeps clupeoides TaxID=299321 RepID=A0AAY4DAW8_9TELE
AFPACCFLERTFLLHGQRLKWSYEDVYSVQQHYLLDPASEGHNVTLNCTVISGGCAGEHSVYWFRHGAPGSHPGIIYTHGDRSAGCEKNPEAGSSTQSCVYHLPKRNLSTTEAGTYYCAVAACGRIVFGNGTKLEISSKGSTGQRSVSSRLGGSVTLTCFSNEDSLALWIWHKQTPGQPMKPVVSAFSNRATFEDGVDKDHYEVESSKKSFNLTIKDIVAADEGLYYCGILIFNIAFVIINQISFQTLPRFKLSNLPINISNTCLLQHDDALNYAALSFSSNKRRKMKKREETSVVYSGLVS